VATRQVVVLPQLKRSKGGCALSASIRPDRAAKGGSKS
jgi:hypothetical protein